MDSFKIPSPKMKVKSGVQIWLSDRGLACHNTLGSSTSTVNKRKPFLPASNNVAWVEYFPSMFKTRSSILSSKHKQGFHLNIMSCQSNIPRCVSSEPPKIKDQLPHPCPAAVTAILSFLPSSTLTQASHCPLAPLAVLFGRPPAVNPPLTVQEVSFSQIPLFFFSLHPTAS